jgi:hypothetical protein
VADVHNNFTTSTTAIRTNSTSASIDLPPSSAAIDMESFDDVKMVDNIPDSNVFTNDDFVMKRTKLMKPMKLMNPTQLNLIIIVRGKNLRTLRIVQHQWTKMIL